MYLISIFYTLLSISLFIIYILLSTCIYMYIYISYLLLYQTALSIHSKLIQCGDTIAGIALFSTVNSFTSVSIKSVKLNYPIGKFLYSALTSGTQIHNSIDFLYQPYVCYQAYRYRNIMFLSYYFIQNLSTLVVFTCVIFLYTLQYNMCHTPLFCT